MAAYDRVLVEMTGGIGTLTLNRPDKLNAFDGSMCDDVIDALGMLTRADAVRVVIITGAGRAFCAGADLGALGGDGRRLVAAGKTLALMIRAAGQPVIAAVNGAAAGGGANLALACDYRIAAQGAALGQVFAKLGLGPDWGGSYFLPRLAGTSKALELLWSARMVPAPEALALGLFDHVVPADDLLSEARKLATAWTAFPALALRRAKEAVYGAMHDSLAGALEREVALQDELFETAEARERLAAQSTRSR